MSQTPGSDRPICGWPVSGLDVPNVPCPRCSHSLLMHANTDDCTTCRVEAAAKRASAREAAGYAWMVVMSPGGVFGVYLNQERAHEAAEAIEGVVVRVPITGDYRA